MKNLAEVVLPRCEESTCRDEFQGFCGEIIGEARIRANKANIQGEDHSHICNSFITRSLGVIHDVYHNQDMDDADKQEKLLFNGRKQATENKRLLADVYVEHMKERASAEDVSGKTTSDTTSISRDNNNEGDTALSIPERTIPFPRYVPAVDTPSRPSRRYSSPVKKRGKITTFCLEKTNRAIQEELDATKRKLAVAKEEIKAAKMAQAVAEKDLQQQRQQLDDTKSDVELQFTEMQALHSTIKEDLQNKLKALKKEVKAAKQAQASAEKDLQQKQQQLDDAKRSAELQWTNMHADHSAIKKGLQEQLKEIQERAEAAQQAQANAEKDLKVQTNLLTETLSLLGDATAKISAMKKPVEKENMPRHQHQQPIVWGVQHVFTAPHPSGRR